MITRVSKRGKKARGKYVLSRFSTEDGCRPDLQGMQANLWETFNISTSNKKQFVVLKLCTRNASSSLEYIRNSKQKYKLFTALVRLNLECFPFILSYCCKAKP